MPRKTRVEKAKTKDDKNEVSCIACAIINKKFKTATVAISDHFDAHQDYRVPIPGFIIVASKRHVHGVDEFTKNERHDFIEILCQLRNGMKKALDIKKVQIFQDEDTQHHFHLWIFPRYPWMNEKFGKKIESVRLAMEYAS